MESKERNDSDHRIASIAMTAKGRYVYLCAHYMNSQALEPHSIRNHILFLICTAEKAIWTINNKDIQLQKALRQYTIWANVHMGTWL